MLIMALYALCNGRPQMLLAPYDRAGNMCGFVLRDDHTGLEIPHATEMIGFNYLYIEGKQGQSDTGHCVSHCPKNGDVASNP